MQQTACKIRSGGHYGLCRAAASGWAAGLFLSTLVVFNRKISCVQVLTSIDKSSVDFSMLRDQDKSKALKRSSPRLMPPAGFLALTSFTTQAIPGGTARRTQYGGCPVNV
jgi:hypothetical protein